MTDRAHIRVMTSTRRALVIGGGIAGPALGLFLKRAGVEPHVFEAYPRTDDAGGGFQIAPNGMRVLGELGLAEALLREGSPSGDMAFRNHRGRDIGLVRTAKAGTAVNIGRSNVHRILRDAAERAGIVVHYGKRLRDLSVAGPEVVATFEDETTEVGDLLIGADGVHSRVRACMLPDEAAPRDTQMVSLGGFCARDFAPPADPRDATRLTFVVGPKYQFGYSRMNDGLWGWWCHAHASSDAERTALLTMSSEELGACMLERYAGWSEPVERLIRGTVGWLRTPIHDVPHLSTWHEGPVLLIGDAAHAMSPAGGQGASLALEDAMLFAKLAADSSRPIADAMSRFEMLRRSRAEAAVAQAYANDRRTLQELGPFGMWTRDRVMMPLFARFIEKALNDVYSAPLET
jgi:2-polyprenyl-6-methoxyphenol hydroxylase-like FAD-dependent oxidoreductase